MRDIRELSESLEVRFLNDTDIDEVFDVYKSNPFYFQYMNIVPEKKTVLDDMKMLPRGKGMEDKFFLGFYGEEKLIAVMDLIFQYPNEKTAFIGLFMMERFHQGKGIGSKIIRETEKYLVRNGFGYIRLAFIRGNKESEGFWRKNGFFPTGVQIEQENYTMVVMEKEIKKHADAE